MNKNSYLCKFIAENPDDWQQRLERDYYIKCKRDGDLAIFNYGYECDFANPLVQEARGIIINVNTLEVVCFPFRKFGNHNEYYADGIDWESARVQEKVDGSIIKLWYNELTERWQFSTNGLINAERATVEGQASLTFGEVIRMADNYGKIPFDTLSRDCTYIFELVSPYTKVIVDYGKTTLYHIGTRNAKSGLESDTDIGIKKPESYPLRSLEECLEAAKALNQTSDEVGAEGYVVVDKDFNRVKVKSPDYLMQHRLRLSADASKKTCVMLVLGPKAELDIAMRLNPSLLPHLKYYDYKICEIIHEARMLTDLAKKLLIEYSGDRGAMARIISKHPLGTIAFRSIDRNTDARELLLQLPIEKVLSLIPTYEPSDLSDLF